MTRTTNKLYKKINKPQVDNIMYDDGDDDNDVLEITMKYQRIKLLLI